MKKITIFTSLSLAVFTMVLPSCSEDYTPTTNLSDKSIQMTVYASREDISTRTLLEEVEGNLACAWEKGDQLLVTNAEGGKLGYLTLTDADKGQFDGSLVGISGDHMTLNYFYLGHDTDLKKVSGSYSLDFTSQTGTLEACGDNDLLSAQANVAIIDDKAYVEGTLNLKRFITFAHFKLNFSDGVEMIDGTVTISGTNVTTQSSFGLKDRILSDKKTGTITVSDTDGDFYICLIPADAVALSFKATVSGVSYEGNLSAKDIAEGIYLRKAIGEGVPVEMKTTVDHSKNPLLKWAESNLVYNSLTQTSSFADSESDKGSLYQWGRNIGFSDYKDALGTLQGNTYDYAVCGVSYCHSGMGLYSSNSLYSPMIYNTSTTISNLTNRFLINGYSTGTDYYIWNNGGSTWEERAIANKYSIESPCPKGWRLPTMDDFKEIVPSKTYENSQSLEKLVSTISEIKSNKDCTYAIRWIKESDGLRIEALVVPKGTTINQIDWTDNNVMYRKFGFTGTIEARCESFTESFGTDIIARPLPDGSNTTSRKTTNDGSFVYYIWTNIQDWGVSSLGTYWMSDKIGGFSFKDNSKYSSYGDSKIGLYYLEAQGANAIRCVKE